MLTRRQGKEKIKAALAIRQKEINVDLTDAIGVFREVMKENPELAIGIQKYSVSHSYSLMSSLSSIKITYSTITVPETRRFRAETLDDVSDILHRAMETYMPDFLIVSKTDLAVCDEIGSFFTYYDGFYSNFVNYEVNSLVFKEIDVSQVTVRIKYRIGRVLLNMMEKQVDKEIERLAKTLFCSGMSDALKAYIAHNYLASTISYHLKKDASALELSHQQSAYGGLIDHKCVCQGYAEAYKRLLDAAGVYCDVVCGKIKGSLEYHAWNLVRIGGNNYHVDVTWDSMEGGRVIFDYFCISDKRMQPKRLWTRRKNAICESEHSIADDVHYEIKMNKSKYASLGVDTKYLV